jgi:hypothetical protein
VIPDLSFALISCIVISFFSTNIAIVLLTLCWAIVASTPLFMISSLLPRSLGGFFSGLVIAKYLLILTSIAIGLATEKGDPLWFATIFLGGIIAMNVFQRHVLLQRWLERRLRQSG